MPDVLAVPAVEVGHPVTPVVAVEAHHPPFHPATVSPARRRTRPAGARNDAVYETATDLVALQQLLDRSTETAGPHLESIITPERRMTAEELCAALPGMRLLVLATVTADSRPLAGPVDGIFYRGAFHFGTSPDSVRARHINRRPAVSATHLPGEHLAVTVHGRAAPIDVRHPDQAGFRATLLEVYTPRYGAEWEAFLDGGPVYYRIEARRMFVFNDSGLA